MLYKKTTQIAWFSYFCDPAGTRTQDPNIKSVVLYQLSYGISQNVLFLGVQK